MNHFILALLVIGVIGCSKSDHPPSRSGEPAALTLPAGMARVADPSHVCMINDQFMGRPQIPVVVDGRTYYGCCPACKDKLENQPASRTALDPVTGEQVDKARAVIVQDPTGRVLYFASDDTLRRYHG